MIALKRHHRERLKNNRRFHWGRDLREAQDVWGQVVNTPTPCSCFMCRNRRQDGGDTRNEKRRDLRLEMKMYEES